MTRKGKKKYHSHIFDHTTDWVGTCNGSHSLTLTTLWDVESVLNKEATGGRYDACLSKREDGMTMRCFWESSDNVLTMLPFAAAERQRGRVIEILPSSVMLFPPLQRLLVGGEKGNVSRLLSTSVQCTEETGKLEFYRVLSSCNWEKNRRETNKLQQKTSANSIVNSIVCVNKWETCSWREWLPSLSSHLALTSNLSWMS